jgi:O-methyltransferase domain/Dimerisation domain
MTDDEDAVARLLEMTRGYVVTKTLFVAAQLGIADLLADGPRPAAELAAATGGHPRALHRILRALASYRVFAETEPGVFTLGELGDLLRTDAPGSLRHWVLTNGGLLYHALGHAEQSALTGEPAFRQAYGADLFAYLATDPEQSTTFDAAMADFSRRSAAAVLMAYDLSAARHLVDVGGGNGAFAIAALRAHERLNATVFDQPHVVEAVLPHAREAGVAERCSVVAGDFFAEVPSGGDTYVLSWIVHDWDDERALRILRNCRAAMPDDGRLLLVEAVVPDGNAPHFSKFGDIVMLVALGGQERTAAEYRVLLESAGFRLEQIVATAGPRSVLEARPV